MHTRGSWLLRCARVLRGVFSISGFLLALDVFLRLFLSFLSGVVEEEGGTGARRGRRLWGGGGLGSERGGGQ